MSAPRPNTQYQFYQGPNQNLRKTSRIIFKLKNGLKALTDHK